MKINCALLKGYCLKMTQSKIAVSDWFVPKYSSADFLTENQILNES